MFLGEKLPLVQYHQAGVPWPSTDILRGMTFDYTIHEPKYEGIIFNLFPLRRSAA